MEIRQYIWDIVDSNSWMAIENNHGLLIDAVDNGQLFQDIEKLDSLTIILTHAHFDHIVGLNKIREIRSDCKLITSNLCSEHIGNKYRNMSSSATAFLKFYKQGMIFSRIDPFECDPADEVVDAKTQFTWIGNIISLFPVYGHTNDGLLITINGQILFTGDTLLHVPVITRFPSGSREEYLKHDLPLLRNLKAEKVFPGHGSCGNLQRMLE